MGPSSRTRFSTVSLVRPLQFPVASGDKHTIASTGARFFATLVFVFVLSSYYGSSSAYDLNGGTGPGGDPPIVVDAGWSATDAVPPAFSWMGGTGSSSSSVFTFTSGGPTILRITDDFCKGDQFRIFDFETPVGDTSPVEATTCSGPGEVSGVGPDTAFADPTYSHGSFPLGPGDHSITIQAIVSPFGGGRGYIRVDSVPLAANNDSYSTNEDTVLNSAAAEPPTVLSNDTPSSGLTAVLVSFAGGGTLTLSEDGAFIYTPATHFYGTTGFTYKASNGTAFSNVATVTITVNHVNHPPVADPDDYITNKNTLLSVPAPGVLANDTDVDVQDILTAGVVTLPSHGSLGLSSGGSLTYTPNAGFVGTDSFTYQAKDSAGAENSFSNVATVTIKVNDPGAQTATVSNFSSTCEVTLSLTFNATTVDSFVVRPVDFFKHWNCRLVKKSTGEEIAPHSRHGAPGTTLDIGNPTGGDLELIPAGATKTFTARGNLCEIFPGLQDADYTAVCTAENSITDPTAKPDGTCLDTSGVECLGHSIRTYVEDAQPFDFGTTQGATTVADQCPDLAGNILSTGCPLADTIEVILNGAPLKNVVVRVFDQNSPDFRAVTGGAKYPPASLYPKVYEVDKGRAAACVTRSFGLCAAGLRAISNYLAIVKFTNPSTGAADYAGMTSSAFSKGIAGTLLNIRR